MSSSLLVCEVSDTIMSILYKGKLKLQCSENSNRNLVKLKIRSLLYLFDFIYFYWFCDPLYFSYLPATLIELITGILTSGSLNLLCPLWMPWPPPTPHLTPMYLNDWLAHHLPHHLLKYCKSGLQWAGFSLLSSSIPQTCFIFLHSNFHLLDTLLYSGPFRENKSFAFQNPFSIQKGILTKNPTETNTILNILKQKK